mmetsp:Transcript_3561/g.5151  ORF Transcript_3561/g.5151 Transcript_3561/m.5151 type:complete len:114 (+) Transcript_3561:332-673(+)|eukprot:CAMPEP_0203748714 /NCGR_PEP_ID=MMETSP0098-20131031/3531_1 /ASSEMBLY_ACC=CAM_ASM_000208 /TAXON_ID=96639 /ORGANISM=" , Strain NY0313808BC1" /LENGTH=113 /DNA_ID=CAMNT_0050637567 /DNA_START=1437 /DNA_END=1778 /DNA_ORIENTATION=+
MSPQLRIVQGENQAVLLHNSKIVNVQVLKVNLNGDVLVQDARMVIIVPADCVLSSDDRVEETEGKMDETKSPCPTEGEKRLQAVKQIYSSLLNGKTLDPNMLLRECHRYGFLC